MNSDIKDKISKLLNMAEHPNSNQHEAAIAMQKAQALLFEHNISMADIKTGDNGNHSPAGIGKLEISEAAGYQWKRILLHVIANNNLCQTIASPRENTSHIFGTYDNVKSVVEMYNWIKPELERLAIEAWNRYRADDTGHESCRVWKRGFFMGACTAINKRLAESLNEFSAGSGHAIVPYNAGLVKDAVKRVFPHVTTSRSSSRSYDGHAAGKAAGRNMNLAKQHKLNGVLALR